jgi:steroid delta-isomerase-like uncharacterized protein
MESASRSAYRAFSDALGRGNNVGSEWLDQYIEAWLLHPYAASSAGADAMAALLAIMAHDVRYEDVPSATVFEGHEGIADMCAGAYQMSADLTFEVVSRQTDGRRYAFETIGTGTSTGSVGPIPATGQPITLRGISVGERSDEGRVQSHRDYWDMASLLIQLGVMPNSDA